jgi:hypothetical protein
MMNQLLIEPYTYRRKQAYAIALATVIYLLFVAVLLLDVHYYQTEQSRRIQEEEEKISAHPVRSQQDKGPAPVRFMNMPTQSAPQAPIPIPQQPSQQTAPSPVANPVAAMVQPQPASKKSTESPEKERIIPKVVERKAEEKPMPQEASQARPEPKKRSKNKWFKPSDSTQPTAQQMSTTQKNSSQNMTRQQFASNLSQGFNNFVTQRKKTSFQYSINRVKGNAAESLEYEMFAGKMVQNICTATHFSPLDLRKALIREHDIIVQVTCHKNRTIGDITFLQPSYDDQINDYLIAIMKTVSPPQFPSNHTTSTLTFPMKIHISRQYYGRGLRMVPA